MTERSIFARANVPFSPTLTVTSSWSTEGQIDPRWVRKRIGDQYYDSIITTIDMFSDEYLKYDSGLPGSLVEEARLRYQPRGEFFGLFFYVRRWADLSLMRRGRSM